MLICQPISKTISIDPAAPPWYPFPVAKPKKDRFVQQPPAAAFFKPRGIPLADLEVVVLGVDEYEAIRLVDGEKLHLEEAAERLRVSRATCARILDSAHEKIATALTYGRAIRIEGGSFVLGRNRFQCLACGSRWETELPDAAQAEGTLDCPSCSSPKVRDIGKEFGFRDGSRPPAGPGWHGGRHGPAGGRGRGWGGSGPQGPLS